MLIAGIGLASHVALRVAGERHGLILAGVLGGLLSSTATTMLYARRSGQSPPIQRFASTVVRLANLIPLVRVALLAAVVAPGLCGR